jgi:hypothetical protein
MLRDYRVFFMGHKGDIEHRYTVNRRNLPYEVIEDMREAFQRSQRYLCSSSSGSGDAGEDAEGLRERAYRQLLMVAGFTDRKIDEQRLLDLTDEELAARIKERLKPPAVESKGLRQKLILLDELEKYLGEGWRCEHVIESMGKAVVSLPEGEVRT